MNTSAAATTDYDDAELVELSRTGDRDAFGHIVARYQALICGLAYSATGSRSHSEDLAQETFLTAWRKLADLREPNRLCAWLCGIARHVIQGDLRRLGRQPAHAADSLETAPACASAEPLPDAQAVSNEELAILWNQVGSLPETYREPLILFYRDHKSVEHVAAALDLTPDAVMQRLSRGRRLLQERMLAFVESTLQRTNPGPQFMLQVQAALPIVVGAGPALVVGTAAGTAAKSGAALKGGQLGFLLAWVAPFVGVFAALGMSWAEIAQARTPRERRLVVRYTAVLWLSVAVLLVALVTAYSLSRSAGWDRRDDWTATAPQVAVWFGFLMTALTVVVLMNRGKAALRRRLQAEGLAPSATPATPSLKQRAALALGFLTATFWAPVFLALRTGDNVVAGAILAGVFLLGAVPLWLTRRRTAPIDEEKTGGWYVAFCALVLLGVLNWRMQTWLAALYGVDLATMNRLLPAAVLHWLSVIAVAWTATLVFLTRPDEEP